MAISKKDAIRLVVAVILSEMLILSGQSVLFGFGSGRSSAVRSHHGGVAGGGGGGNNAHAVHEERAAAGLHEVVDIPLANPEVRNLENGDADSHDASSDGGETQPHKDSKGAKEDSNHGDSSGKLHGNGRADSSESDVDAGALVAGGDLHKAFLKMSKTKEPMKVNGKTFQNKPFEKMGRVMDVFPCDDFNPECARDPGEFHFDRAVAEYKTPHVFHAGRLKAGLNKKAKSYGAIAQAISNKDADELRKQLVHGRSNDNSKPHVGVMYASTVDPTGRVYNDMGSFVPHACSQSSNPLKHANEASQKEVDEIAVISQYFGYGFFHFTLENWIRLFPMLPYLQEHEEIRIHAVSNSGFTASLLKLVGINPDRIVTGHVFAEVVYIPEPVRCGRPTVGMLRLARRMLLSILKIQHAPPTDTLQIVVVQRTGARAVSNHNQLVKKLGEIDHVNVNVMGGSSQKENFALFASADVVIAPHGAGLSHLIVSKPTVKVIEMLVAETNICYWQMSARIGLEYYAMLPQDAHQDKPMTAPIPKIVDLVNRFVGELSG